MSLRLHQGKRCNSGELRHTKHNGSKLMPSLCSGTALAISKHLKSFRSAIASLKLKRKATASEQSHSRPSPFCHPPRNGLTASLLLIPLTPYKEVIFNREDSKRGHRGCTRGPQPRYGLAVLPMTLLSRTNARPSERDLNNRFSCNLTERRLL